jgi:hypothetical protein
MTLVGAGRVEDPVHHDGSHLQPRRARERVHPPGREPRHVALVDLVERAPPVAAELTVVGRPVRLRRHLPVPFARLSQQMNARLVAVVAQELQVPRRLVQRQPAQGRAVGHLDGDAPGGRPPGEPERAEEGHQLAHLVVLEGEAGHAGCRQALPDERLQLWVLACEQAPHDPRPELASVAIAAVAAGAEPVVLLPSRR